MSGDNMDWRKLYRHESTEDRLWTLTARAVRDHVLRLPDDIDGVIFRRSTRPIDDLLRVLGVHQDEEQAIRNAVVFLLEVGYLEVDGEILRIRNFEAYQGARKVAKTNAQRQKEYRERQRNRAGQVPVGSNESNSPVSNALRNSNALEEEEDKEEEVERNSVTPSSTAPPKGQVTMTADWSPSPGQVANLEMGGVVPSAVPRLAAAFRSVTMGKSDRPENWDRSFGRWAMREWSGKRSAYMDPKPEGKQPLLLSYG